MMLPRPINILSVGDPYDDSHEIPVHNLVHNPTVALPDAVMILACQRHGFGGAGGGGRQELGHCQGCFSHPCQEFSGDADRNTIGTRQRIDITPRYDDRFHAVIDGDRIDQIAHLWWIVADHNDLFFPLELETGAVLCLPSVEHVQMRIQDRNRLPSLKKSLTICQIKR
jgi:hypothetical protein